MRESFLRNCETFSKADTAEIENHSARNYKRYPFVVSRARGAWLYDVRGQEVLDLLAGYSAVLSHLWEVPVNALVQELSNGCDLVSNVLYTKRYAEFVSKITAYTGYDRVMPKSDGGSITDSAMKVLFQHGTRRGLEDSGRIILIKDYFHGRARTFATNAFFDHGQSAGAGPRALGIDVAEHDIADIQRKVGRDTVGIFMEIHRGEGGPLFDDGTYGDVWRLCKERGLFLVVDDIQAGLYRCGHFLSHWEFGKKYRPDAVVLGKVLGGGVMPVSALVGTEEFMSVLVPGSDGSTHGGFPPACAVASAVLDYLHAHPETGKRAEDIGARFAKNLSGIPNVEITYRGALIAIAIRGIPSAEPLCRAMLNEKYPVFVKHGHVHDNCAYIRMSPPVLAITNDMIDNACTWTIRPCLERAREIAGTCC